MNSTLSIGCCGCDCTNCPTYKNNIRTREDRIKCSDGWSRFLNIKLSSEKLRACDGCSISDKDRKTFYLNCKIRKCSITNGFENCAYCSGFPCNELLKIHRIQEISNQKEFMEKTGIEITEKEYGYFVHPYAGLVHLNNFRKTMEPGTARPYKKFSINVRFVPFPADLKKSNSLKFIYKLLTTLCVEEDISYARLLSLESRREHLLKILWTIGLYGKSTDNDSLLELDANIFLSQKLPGMYNTLLGYIGELHNAGVHCEVIPLVKTGWLTPMGGLRKEGWKFTLGFGKSSGDRNTLRTYKSYITNLEAKYGNKGYRFFKVADLNILL